MLLLPLLTTCLLADKSEAMTPIDHIPAQVDFGKTMQEWDGFGFNYVENCQSRDIDSFQQDLGGFSQLGEPAKKEIIEAVFGEEGLAIPIIKMFLDPWHQRSEHGPFDHTSTTKNMLEFVERGLALTQQQGNELTVITTLYGPPPWATLQNHIGGRDLDSNKFTELADYLIHWAMFLRKRGIPVRYLSIHNEGEDFYRWNFEDGTQRLERFDFNAYWTPELVNEFIIQLADRLQQHEIEGEQIGISNGEPSNWTRFRQWGYADALAANPEVMKNLDLITTHGFINGNYDKLSYGIVDAYTTHLLRSKKPELKAWVTSYSWGDMNTVFVKQSHEHIYLAGVNALIPWAGIQDPTVWLEGDPNSGNAITVHQDGTYELTPAYYLYKQLTQAGRPGTRVAYTQMVNPVCNLFAFSGQNSGHPDAFVVVDDILLWGLPFAIELKNTNYTLFQAYRSSTDGKEQYENIGVFEVENGQIRYDPPAGTVTTFIGVSADQR